MSTCEPWSSSDTKQQSVNDILQQLRQSGQVEEAPKPTWTMDRPWTDIVELYGHYWHETNPHLMCKVHLDDMLGMIFVEYTKANLTEWRKDYLERVSPDDEGVNTWTLFEACSKSGLRRMSKPRIYARGYAIGRHRRRHRYTREEGKAIRERLQTIREMEEELTKIAEIKSCEDGMECEICMDAFHTTDLMACQGRPARNRHFTCVRCFVDYVVKTRNLQDPVSFIPCPAHECKSQFRTQRVVDMLPQTMLKKMQANAHDTDTKVALNANVKCTVHCTCGITGVVDQDEKEDRVQCPCGLQFCIQCGNEYHGESDCPPKREVLQWISSTGKLCPNCGTGIERNGGCVHMTCSREVGGCGHEFCWTCVGNWPRCHCVENQENLEV